MIIDPMKDPLRLSRPSERDPSEIEGGLDSRTAAEIMADPQNLFQKLITAPMMRAAEKRGENPEDAFKPGSLRLGEKFSNIFTPESKKPLTSAQFKDALKFGTGDTKNFVGPSKFANIPLERTFKEPLNKEGLTEEQAARKASIKNEEGLTQEQVAQRSREAAKKAQLDNNKLKQNLDNDNAQSDEAKSATDNLLNNYASESDDEQKGVLGKKYIDEYMSLMPEYEGKSEFEKGLDLMKLGMAISSGESSNALQNISKGFLAMGDTFLEDEKEQRAFKNQVRVSAAKYAMDQLKSDRADKKALNYFFDKDGNMEVLSKEDLINGKRPSKNFFPENIASSVMTLAANRINAVNDGLKEAQIEEKESKRYQEGYKNNVNLNAKAVLGLELTEGVMAALTDEDQALTGLAGSVTNLTEKAKAVFGIDANNYKNEKGKIDKKSRQRLIADMRKIFQLMIPLTLGEAQSANSISDRDVSILAKAAMAAILDGDATFGELTVTSAETLYYKLQNANDMFKRKAAETQAELQSLDNQFANKLIVDIDPDTKGVRKRFASAIVQPFKDSAPFNRGDKGDKVISLDAFESSIQQSLNQVTDEDLQKLLGDENLEIEDLPMGLQDRARELKSKKSNFKEGGLVNNTLKKLDKLLG